MEIDHPKNIVLASSSAYRKALLSRLNLKFESASPDINEVRLQNELFAAMAERLAKEKANALKTLYREHLIIGSDQVACLQLQNRNSQKDELQLHKPITKEKCFEQLKLCQGKLVHFYTGICLLNSKTGRFQSSVEHYQTKFRTLVDEQLRAYIEKEPALDCAGGFKMEGLGIALFEHMHGDDPNSLIGLPLIRLISMFNNEGVDVLSSTPGQSFL